MKKTKNLDKKIAELKEKILPILKKNGVVKASVFGSFARGEEKKDSDIDMLVEFEKPKGLFFFVGLKRTLEKSVGKKVDLLTYNSIHPLLKDYIYKDEIKIYDQRRKNFS
ncbi:nucleotidyltransferase family protein [Candidatus Falkowbacteria bacterium]|nr:nucleotidyltransferase family protein [Candidatus Falkowbacteria bacterium]